MPRPAKKKRLTERYFKESRKDGFIQLRSECLYCHEELTHDHGRKWKHLVHCDLYLTKIKETGIDNEITLEAKQLSNKQLTLTMPKLNKGIKARLYRMAAQAVIIGARLFSLFKEPYIKRYIQSVSSNTYSPLEGDLIGGDLLDSIYINLKTEVDTKLVTTLTKVKREQPKFSS